MLYFPVPHVVHAGRSGRTGLDIYDNKTGNIKSSADDSKDCPDDLRGISSFLYFNSERTCGWFGKSIFPDWKKTGIPVHEMAVIVMIAFRFIPIMLEELNVLMDAQAARGAKFEDGNILEKCKGVMTLLLPLFLLTVRRSSDLAMAMEARGYTGSGKTSRMYPLVYKKKTGRDTLRF